jgi:Flp pilus assembly CpaF family ATPase
MAINERLPDLIRNVRSTPDDVAKRSVASAFDLVIQISRNSTGFRYISEISALSEKTFENNNILLNKIFTTNNNNGKIEYINSGKIHPDSKLGIKLISSSDKSKRWLDV